MKTSTFEVVYTSDNSKRDYLCAYRVAGYQYPVYEIGVTHLGKAPVEFIPPDINSSFPQHVDTEMEIPFPVAVTTSGALRMPRLSGVPESVFFYRYNRGNLQGLYYVKCMCFDYLINLSVYSCDNTTRALCPAPGVEQNYTLHLLDREVKVTTKQFPFVKAVVAQLINAKYFAELQRYKNPHTTLYLNHGGGKYCITAIFTEQGILVSYKFLLDERRAMWIFIKDEVFDVSTPFTQVAAYCENLYKQVQQFVCWKRK